MQGSQTFVIDIDDTISVTEKDENGDGIYPEAKPIQQVIDKINYLYQVGHTIILLTARGMRTFQGNTKKIDVHHRPILEKWLSLHNVNYHTLIFGKPWGPNVHYIDDRGLTVDQFVDNKVNEFETCLTINKSNTYAKL